MVYNRMFADRLHVNAKVNKEIKRIYTIAFTDFKDHILLKV